MFSGKEAVFSVEGSVFNGRKQCFQFREVQGSSVFSGGKQCFCGGKQCFQWREVLKAVFSVEGSSVFSEGRYR